MKIACIGNMNNGFFCLVRYLRQMGYDASLLLFEEQPHFLPDADTYNDEYKTFTKEIDWTQGVSGLYHTSAKNIRNSVKEYDFFITCGKVPAYLFKAGIKSDIFIPYGHDLHTIPRMKINGFNWRKWHKVLYLREMQKRAIRNSKNISMEVTNESFEKEFFDPIQYKGNRINVTCPFIYYPQYQTDEFNKNKEKSSLYSNFRSVRDKFEVVIMQHCRQEWLKDGGKIVNPWTWSKGNDFLIKQFANYLRNNDRSKVCLILFEYGSSVFISKELILQLGIEDNVFWFPISKRKDIMLCIDEVDLGVGELYESWFSYGAAMEYMAMGVPLMHKRIDSFYTDKNLYPFISGNCENEIYHGIERAIKSKTETKKIGIESKQWYIEECVNKPLSLYKEIINQKIKAI